MPLYDAKYATHQEGLANRVARAWEWKAVIKRLDPKPGERILEIGCNRGAFVEHLRAQYGADAFGIDLNEAAIRGSQNPYLAVMPAEKLAFKDGSIDKIVSMHTMEHFENPQEVANEMQRVARNGADMVLTYPVEPFRGITSIASALRQYGNPFKAGLFHRHAYIPFDIYAFFKGTLCYSDLIFTPMPVFITSIRKGEKSNRAENYFAQRHLVGVKADFLQPVRLLQYADSRYRGGDFWWENNLGYLDAKLEDICTPPTNWRKTILGIAKIVGALALMGLGIGVSGDYYKRLNPDLDENTPPYNDD